MTESGERSTIEDWKEILDLLKNVYKNIRLNHMKFPVFIWFDIIAL